MKIKTISIQNFRSVKDVQKLVPNDFNVFVGQNNHGKTNIFEAIEWFFLPTGEMSDICFMRQADLEVKVEIEFTGLQSALNLISNDKQKKVLEDIFGTSDEIIICRNCKLKEGQERYLFNPKTEKWENPLGRDTTWRQFLPTLEYVSTRKMLEDVAKYGKTTPISKMLSAVLENMLETDQEYGEFKKMFNELFGEAEDPEQKTQIRKNIDSIGGTVAAYLQKQFPDCVEVKFKVENPELEDLFKKFKTSVNDGVENDSSEKGDGMQRALMLAIIQAYASFRKNNGESKDFLFLIDEAELHLHPTAQRALKNALLEIAKGKDQVFINTHSSVLVADDHEIQTIFKVEKSNKISQIVAINDSQKPYIVYELLGGSPADLLLPKNFLITEGKSDLEFITRVISRHYSEKPQIQVIPADGDIYQAERSFNAIEQIFKPFENSIYKKTVVILLDKQTNEKGAAEFFKKHDYIKKDEQYFESPKGSLEEYYPVGYCKTPDEIKLMKNGEEKVELAKEVGEAISKDDFEKEMATFLTALEKCWEKAFQ